MSDTIQRHRRLMCGYQARNLTDLVNHLRTCQHPTCKKFVADAIRKSQAGDKPK